MEIKFNKSVGGKKKLALTFLLYNEGQTIAEAIKAFHHNGVPIYDTLVVGIDKKTTDNTTDIVRQFCPEENIMMIDFNNSFGESRNKILREIEKIDVDYVFMPDGHEILTKDSIDIVKWIVEQDDPKTRMVSPWLELPPNGKETPFWRPMFFRNKEGIFFRRDIHNFLYDPTEQPSLKHANIRLSHDMPTDRAEMRKKQRAEMNIKGLMPGAKKGDIRDMFYVGVTYYEAGDYKQSEKWLKKALEESDFKDRDISAQIAITLGNIYVKENRLEDLEKIAYVAIQYRWDRAEPYCHLGYKSGVLSDKLEQGSMEFVKTATEAVHWFQIASTMSRPITAYFLNDPDYTWRPWDALMNMKALLGDVKTALMCSKKTLQYLPGDQRVLNNTKKIQEFEAKRKGAEIVNFNQPIKDEGAKLLDPFMLN